MILNKLVGERGSEPPTPWSRNDNRSTISLIRLAWFCVTDHGFTRFSAVIGPKLDPSFLQASFEITHSCVAGFKTCWLPFFHPAYSGKSGSGRALPRSDMNSRTILS